MIAGSVRDSEAKTFGRLFFLTWSLKPSEVNFAAAEIPLLDVKRIASCYEWETKRMPTLSSMERTVKRSLTSSCFKRQQ